MRRWSVTGFCLVIFISQATAQLPPRLQIPGAAPVGGSRPAPFRIQNNAPLPRLRSRPNAISSPVREVRPVVEDVEEPNYPSPSPATSVFDEEVNKLSQFQGQDEEEERSNLAFRPERPVPIARDQIRDKPAITRPLPVPQRQVIRQDLRDEPVRQPPRQQVSRPAPAPAPAYRPKPQRQQVLDDDDEDYRQRKRKPVEILRKYRTDNEDGSITWGFENDDGTFKEETLGADCIISGRYGYVDPDGVKREFSYEAGNKCDEPELDEEEELLAQQKPIQSRNKPLPYSRPSPQQPQYVN